MTRPEYFVVILGLLLGYWIVNRFLSGNKNKESHQKAERPHSQTIDQEFAKASCESWAVTLGISQLASVDEIKRAYKSQISKYHPDKVATLGVELRELAERKSKEINIAYRHAMQDHNISERFW